MESGYIAYQADAVEGTENTNITVSGAAATVSMVGYKALLKHSMH
jgi:hypothetical protein